MVRSARVGRAGTGRLPAEDVELVEDFGRLIREARERMGLTQEELASQLNERATIIKKIESGEFRPSIDLAKRIERILKIRIVVPSVEGDLAELSRYLEKGKPAGVTLGDLLGGEKKKHVTGR